MTRKTCRLIPLIAVLGVLATPAAAAADSVVITGFSLSPSCVAPGRSVTGTVTIQDTDWYPVKFVTKGWATYLGQTVQDSGVIGPYPAPPFVPVIQSQTVNIPWYAPWGTYYVNIGTGPDASSPTSWSQRTATLTVSPFCF
jgi:hypothetical protein